MYVLYICTCAEHGLNAGGPPPQSQHAMSYFQPQIKQRISSRVPRGSQKGRERLSAIVRIIGVQTCRITYLYWCIIGVRSYAMQSVCLFYHQTGRLQMHNSLTQLFLKPKACFAKVFSGRDAYSRNTSMITYVSLCYRNAQ